MKLYSSLSYVKNALLRKNLPITSQLKCFVSGYTDPYEVLGLSRDADKAAIKSAYLKLAKLYHPDRNPGNDEAKRKFETVHNAYRQVLERIAKSSGDPRDKDDLGYDFTIEPLGVETHTPPTLVQTRGYMFFWVAVITFLVVCVSKPLANQALSSFLKNRKVSYEDEIRNEQEELAHMKELCKDHDEMTAELGQAFSTLTSASR